MSIDRVGASAAREELLAMIRSSRQAAPAAPARKPQPAALTSPAPALAERPVAEGRMPVRRISIYV